MLTRYRTACAAANLPLGTPRGVVTYDEQRGLYLAGRTMPGTITTDWDSGQSPQNFGVAIEITPAHEVFCSQAGLFCLRDRQRVLACLDLGAKGLTLRQLRLQFERRGLRSTAEGLDDVADYLAPFGPW